MLPVPARLTGESWAFFLDVDGTLLDIADAPDLVHVDPQLLDLLGSLQRATGGALALVSGRSIADLDRLFDPVRLPAAGLHGAERRDAHGHLHRRPVDGRLQRVREEFEAWAAARPGTLVEDKGGAIALHFRLAPAQQSAARRLVERVVASLEGDYVFQEGKLVAEIRPAGVSKATAIRQFTTESPFAGRRPVFIGDDVTDEDGFSAVRDLGGLAVVVGARAQSHAGYCLADVRAVQHWLGDWLARGRDGGDLG
jgi:trehalose 6-phosphate phosphatase